MKIAVATLLISQLAFAQAPDAPAPAAAVPETSPAPAPTTPPAPAAAKAAPTADAPVAAAPALTPADSAAPVAGLSEKDPYRVVSPIALYAVAGVSVVLLIFSIAMDAIATGTRNSSASQANQQMVLNAQSSAVSQTNAANVGFAVGAVFALGTAVLGRFTRWNN